MGLAQGVMWRAGSRLAVAGYNSHHALMDYDATAIPLVYDRGRNHGPEVLDLWMQTVNRYSGSLPLSTILDLGCGTGRFSDALATWFASTVIGVDPSRKMLEQARGKRTKGTVQYVRGGSGGIAPRRPFMRSHLHVDGVSPLHRPWHSRTRVPTCVTR